LEGFYYNKAASNTTIEEGSSGISFLARHGEMEIMTQPIRAEFRFGCFRPVTRIQLNFSSFIRVNWK
jgi:hypothetical protein